MKTVPRQLASGYLLWLVAIGLLTLSIFSLDPLISVVGLLVLFGLSSAVLLRDRRRHGHSAVENSFLICLLLVIYLSLVHQI